MVFLTALVAGAAALALWLDVRFPGLAPAGLSRRVLAAAAATLLLGLVPVGITALSLVCLLLPALTLAFLTALWLLRLVAETAAQF